MSNIKELLLLLDTYKAIPHKAPKDLIYSIVAATFPGYNTYGLHAVGGEAYIIKAQNKLDKDVALKYMFPSLESLEGKRTVTFWEKCKERICFDVKTVNNVNSRFLMGAKLQDLVFQELRRNSIEYFFVPAVYHVLEEPLALEMEWMYGAPLLNWVKSENISVFEKVKIFRNLLLCVKFLHDRGVIHRDLKPGNILIEKNQYTKENNAICLLDWGTSKDCCGNRDLTVHGVGLGSKPYATPKQMENFRDVTFLDEIYSLGFILASLILCQDHPEPISDNPKESYESLALRLRSVILHHKHMPDFFKPTIKKATEPLEEKRFQTIDEFLKEIDDLIVQMNETAEGRHVANLPPLPMGIPTPSMIMDMQPLPKKLVMPPQTVQVVSVLHKEQRQPIPKLNPPEKVKRPESEIPTVITQSNQAIPTNDNNITVIAQPNQAIQTNDNDMQFNIGVFACNYAAGMTKQCAKKNQGHPCLVDCKDCQTLMTAFTALSLDMTEKFKQFKEEK